MGRNWGTINNIMTMYSLLKEGDRVYCAQSVTGTYAEYCLVDEKRLFRLHSNVSFTEGAAIGVPYGTAYRALVQICGVKAGNVVLVHGGSGAVSIMAGNVVLVHGGSGAVSIKAGNVVLVHGGSGVVSIKAGNVVLVLDGSGAVSIKAGNVVLVHGGSGAVSSKAGNVVLVHGGSGAVSIKAGNVVLVHGGSGAVSIKAGNVVLVHGGSGTVSIKAGNVVLVHGGSGTVSIKAGNVVLVLGGSGAVSIKAGNVVLVHGGSGAVSIKAGNVVVFVDSFTYLGSLITNDGSSSRDITSRIAKAASAMCRLSNPLFRKHRISIRTKINMYRALVVSVLLYGSEAWATTLADRRRLDVFDMCC